VPTNFRQMPPNPWEMALRNMGRRLSGKGMHHMAWEAVK